MSEIYLLLRKYYSYDTLHARGRSVDHDATHGLLIYNLYTTHVESYAYY